MSSVKEYKRKLQENYTFLEDNLEVVPVIDLCLEKQVLTFTDLERLRAESCRPDKVKLFLRILTAKASVKSYEVFLETLSHDRVKQQFIRRRLDETVVATVGQHDEDLEQMRVLEGVLREALEVRDKAELPVEDLEKALRFLLHQRHHQCLRLTMAEVHDLVTRVFPAVTRKRNKRRNVTALLNCSLKVETQEEAVMSIPEDAAVAAEAEALVPLEEVSAERVAAVMRVYLENHSMDTSLADKFEEEEMSGDALEHLDDDHIKSLFPELKMGKRLKLKTVISEVLQELQKPPELAVSMKSRTSVGKLETYRTFDTRPGPSDVYEKGHVLPDEQSRPGHLMHPLHKHYILKKGEDENKLAQEAVQFAAACMNERVNGTFHVGVAGKYDSSHRYTAGEIVGLCVDRRKCELAVTGEIYRAFFPDQRQIAIKCIRDPVFVPVVEKNATDQHLYVVEIDVVPHSSLVDNEAFFLSPVSGRHSLFFLYTDGSAKATDGQDLHEFMNRRKQLTEQRKDSERASKPRMVHMPDLNRKLHNLLTGEHEFEHTDIYPILFLAPCPKDMPSDVLLENFSFVKSLAPLAVFDFDPSNQTVDGQPKGVYSVVELKLGQVYKALTTDNFDKDSEENRSCGGKDAVSKLLESIETSSFKSWIFCNGYAPLRKEEFQATTWRAKRGEGFKEAIRFYKGKIPSEKARIMILLLSRNCDVLLGALEEIFTKFPDQWILVAESEKVAQDLMMEVVRRCYVEKNILEERSVIGMPLSHVNQSVMNIFGFNPGTGCTLPSSTHTPCFMKEREMNELSDLEILSMRQCQEDHLVKRGSPEEIEKKKRKMEIDFYRGKQVSWWNFYFGDHVLRRVQFNDLLKEVNKRLAGDIPEDEKVAVISLLHQRGAGGTTTAREILWEKRADVRCCVIRKITDQTCDQIARLRNFQEQSQPQPPLVLIDNEDEEKVFQLCSQMNEKARREARDRGFHVFCVFIICVRMAEFPKKKDKSRVRLGHALQTNEVQWFRTKYENLEERYKKQQLSLHPKLLISFNILKENFNRQYIKDAVGEFVKEIHQFREKQLLKYIALINSFDHDFKNIPMSCFNPIMCPERGKPKQRPVLGQRPFAKDVHWEATLSQSINVLLNRTSESCLGGDVKALRIINSDLSREILKTLCSMERKKVSDVILEFLHSDVFKPSNESSVQGKLVKIMKDMLKKRAASKSGRAKFSPIILEIGNNEGFETAAEVLKVAFEKFDDPMIAQQIARVFIHCQNWTLAEKYARTALHIVPKNSYVCDTHGQVYKEKLMCVLKNCLESEEILEGEKAREIIDMAFEAIRIFRREQMLSDEDVTGYNNCGFFSELRVVVIILDCCRFFRAFKFDKGEKLHHFLVNRGDIPPEMLEELGEERVAQLKGLYHDYERPMRRLEDEQIQLKEDSCYQYSPSYNNSIKERKTFVHLQECLDTYFGEDSDDFPKTLKPEEACEFRRRRVKRRGGNSLRSIYGLREEDNAAREFDVMHTLIKMNVESEHCNAFDLKTMLNLTMARISKDESYTQRLSLENVLEWTLQLYDKTKQDTIPYLEAYLYLVMFHWPTEWRLQQNLQLCPCNKIKDVIREWKAAFQNNHPAQKEQEGKKLMDRRKGTTLFFLGQGEGFHEIVFHSELRAFDADHKMGDGIWNTTEAKKRLKRLRGTLLQGGGEMSVTIHSKAGNATVLTIPTSFPIKNTSLWQKSVYFVLGFCWSGPKAFSVTRDNEALDLQSVSTPVNFPEPKRTFDRSEQKMMSEEAVNEFWNLLYANQSERGLVERDISLYAKNPRKTKDLQKKKESLEKKRLDLVQKRTSMLQGPDL